MNRFIYILLIVFFSCNKVDTPLPTSSQLKTTGIIQNEIDSLKYVIYSNAKRDIFIAYNRTVNGTILDFSYISNRYPTILTDNEGNEWDIFGDAISGPREGQSLNTVFTTKGFWFSLSSMFPVVSLYNEPKMQVLNPELSSPDWLIEKKRVYRSTFKDAIQSIDQPTFDLITKKDLVNQELIFSDEKIILTKINGDLYIYPINILNWHEIVNHKVGGTNFTISHCPLTFTSYITKDANHQFGVSGLLYNNNLIMYEKSSESYWSQILNRAVRGEQMGSTMEKHTFIEMKWSGIAEMLINNAYVLSANTGFDYDYGRYPYGDYRTNHQRLTYPLSYTDNRLNLKEIVFGVALGDEMIIYQYSDFEQTEE